MQIEPIQSSELSRAIERVFALAADKALQLDRRWNRKDGAPVFTVAGKYTTRGWTQWTQGFQFGNALLCYEALGDPALLVIGWDRARDEMTQHLTHTGVHDHGFHTMSTCGQVRRLLLENRIAADRAELRGVELAIRVSGAVQAARWTRLPDGDGFIYSFNGPHSLFIDTMRTLRVCAAAHVLGQKLLGEQDKVIDLLERVCTHARTTAHYNLYFGEGRDIYDTPEARGRTAHESLFNVTNGVYRAPSSQQGFSPFTTWTRGLAWAMLGYSEELEFLAALPAEEFGREAIPPKEEVLALMLRAALATSDYYLDQATASDGICYWDTGAPLLARLGEWRRRPAEPFNAFEPVDASASAIAAQGLIRLGCYLDADGERYLHAGLGVAKTLFQEPYLSTAPDHEGLLLHSVYHRPNGWDHIPPGQHVPCGESSMWGDYHLLELALLIGRLASGRYYRFF